MSGLIYAGIDTETTGLLDPDHRIIEVYAGLWQNGKLIDAYEQRIDPQRSIALEAQRVHGISTGDLFGKPTWADISPDLMAFMSRADVYVAHNGDGFDFPFIDMEMKRVNHPTLPKKPTFDTMLGGIWATHNGKSPRLEELCFACGVDYDKVLAHAAAYDVDRMMECFFKGLDWGFFSVTDSALAA